MGGSEKLCIKDDVGGGKKLRGESKTELPLFSNCGDCFERGLTEKEGPGGLSQFAGDQRTGSTGVRRPKANCEIIYSTYTTIAGLNGKTREDEGQGRASITKPSVT